MKGLQKPLPVLLLLLSLLAVSIAFVGIAAAQNPDCIIDSSGKCSEQTITAPLEPGTYTYEICVDRNGDGDTTDEGECTYETIEVVADTSKPTASITDATTAKIKFGQKLALAGTGQAPSGKTISSYSWESDIDGQLSSSASFSTDSLAVGRHTISFKATSDDSQVSVPATKTVVVSPPDLGDPVKVIPRMVTGGNSVRAYGVPPGSNYFCRISADGNEQACSAASPVVVQQCAGGQILEFSTAPTDKKVNFTIAASASAVGTITKRPVLQSGDLAVTASLPDLGTSGSDLGILTDEDFLVGPVIFRATSPIPITAIDSSDFTKGLFYALYRVSDCKLTTIVQLVALNPVVGSKTKFERYINAPTDCEFGETCSYVIEILEAGSAGGQFAEFQYEKGEIVAGISIDPTFIDFGQVAAGDLVQQTIAITNAGDIPVTDLDATTASQSLSLSLDKTTLAPQESATLTVNLFAPAAALPDIYNENIILSAVAGGEQGSGLIPVEYEIVSGTGTGTGFLVATPSSVNFGQLRPGDTAPQTVIIQNFGSAAVSGLEVIAPVELETTLSKNSLAPQESATLTMTLFIPPGVEDGNYGDDVDVIAETGESVSISVSFTINALAEALACPTEDPPTCEVGESVDSEIDEDGCSVFLCVPEQVKRDKAERERAEREIVSAAEEKGISRLALIITIIIIVAATAFIIFVLAVREGWIDLNDYPLLRDWIRKLGLGPLFEREVEVSRFTPRPPSALGGAAPKPPAYRPPAPPSGQQPQQPAVRRQLTPEERARLEQYMKEHPEYAAWVKKRYGLK